MKQWGKNISVLTDRPDIPRPTAATSKGGQASGSKRKRTEGGVADSEVQDRWDEDDVMLFFWDSKAARERHAQKKQERTEYCTWKIEGCV